MANVNVSTFRYSSYFYEPKNETLAQLAFQGAVCIKVFADKGSQGFYLKNLRKLQEFDLTMVKGAKIQSYKYNLTIARSIQYALL